ncbi:unnamed protein product, partial [marine sediment metagenome]
SSNYSIDGNWWWRCRAVDGNNGNSSYSEIRYLTIDNSTIKNFTANFSATTSEGSTERFEFNVSYNDLQLDYIDAELIYENIHYDLIQENLTDALTRFYTNLNIPLVLVNPATTEFYLNITDVYNNGSVGYESSSNYTQIVKRFVEVSKFFITSKSRIFFIK